MDDLPASVFELLRSNCPTLEFHDITAMLTKLRMVKDEIREALARCDLGQSLMKRHARPGITEI
jgi:hypothetical protein